MIKVYYNREVNEDCSVYFFLFEIILCILFAPV